MILKIDFTITIRVSVIFQYKLHDGVPFFINVVSVWPCLGLLKICVGPSVFGSDTVNRPITNEHMYCTNTYKEKYLTVLL